LEEFANAPFTPTLNDDRTNAQITLASSSLHLSAEQLQTVLRWLGLLRSKMIPAVAAEPAQESTVFASNWFFPSTPANQVGHLALRTSEFGWAMIALSPEARQVLAAALLAVPINAPSNVSLN